LPNDTVAWPVAIDRSMRVELVTEGPEKYQNKGPFDSTTSW